MLCEYFPRRKGVAGGIGTEGCRMGHALEQSLNFKK